MWKWTFIAASTAAGIFWMGRATAPAPPQLSPPMQAPAALEIGKGPAPHSPQPLPADHLTEEDRAGLKRLIEKIQ